MAYRLIGDNNIINPKEQILKNRDTTIEKLNPTEEVVEDFMNYDNILTGINTLKYHIDRGSIIGIIPDKDFDGFASFTMLYRYIKEVFNYELTIVPHTSAKAHGLSEDVKIPDDLNLLIVPDGGTNDQKQIKELEDKGIDVLILDHHSLSEGVELNNGIIVNNQTSKNVQNKNLCGAGVVYKFLYGLSEVFKLPNPSKYLDLCALANIADSIDISSLETRYYVKEGLKNINNKFILALMEVKSYEMEGKNNPHAHSFNTIPLVNATIRSGNFEETMDMLNAFISDDIDYCKKIAKKCKAIKQRQDGYVKKNVERLCKEITINKNDKIIIIEGGVNGSVGGLIATKICDKYKLPCLIYTVNGDECSGSGRGLGNITLREDLFNSGLVTFAQGHSSAFGHSFKLSNLENLKQYMNNLYKDVDFGDSKTYDVDFEIPYFFLDQKFVEEVAEFEDEVVKGFNQPLIVVKNVEIILTDENVKGYTKTNIIFEINGVKFIRKFTSKVWKSQYLYQPLKVDIIGRCVKGLNKAEIEIIDLEFK